MTWGIGANDVANAMGTSVGSGAISVSQHLAHSMLNPEPIPPALK
jgi:phosphate/sulfate permease